VGLAARHDRCRRHGGRRETRPVCSDCRTDTADGIRIDVIFALLSFERDAVHRATRVLFGDRDVRVVTPEDLLLMKIISDRPRDLADAEALTLETRRHARSGVPSSRASVRLLNPSNDPRS
jgi:hypothetical protein